MRTEAQSSRSLQLLSVASKPILEVKCCVAGALPMILVSNRCPEERHDAISGVLINGALESVDSFGEDREEAIHDLVPLLGIYLLGEIHRTLHVGEEHGHLLALAF